ncbi:hypothetical protein H4R35_000979 [Dimargaris xerosporica]|nr:hypothetical protein H4R35_000979 [Dimargaris xerosporica]
MATKVACPRIPSVDRSLQPGRALPNTRLLQCYPWLAQRSLATVQTRSPTPQTLRKVSVAPMVDVTDRFFLHLCDLISPHPTLYSEMIHARALARSDSNIRRFIGPPRTNLVVQLGGNEPSFMAKAAERLQAYGVRALNLNLGCPSQRVQNCQYGAVLMTQPDVVVDICRAIHAVSDLPLSIKCRTGIDHLDSYEFLANFIAHVTPRTQVNHVIVHARKALLKNIPARKNLQIPPLNHDRVRALKQAFPHLSVTLNGGITTTDAIQHHLAYFDGVMVGRKVRDDPLFLLDIDQALHGTTRTRAQAQKDILGQYLAYADTEQAQGFSSLSVLTKPVHYLVDGSHGKAFRGILGRTLAQTKRGTYSASHLVRRCLREAQKFS